jgi:RimJ/RimL family protein N-acetyltransferase
MMIMLETPRLLLRQFLAEDAPFFFALNNDPEVIRYTGDTPFKDMEAAQTFLANYDQYEKYHSGRLSVLLKETGELLGWCGLKYHPQNGETDLGYRFKKIYWNKGYATEASIACLQYGFSVLNLPFIAATAMKENTASIRIMEKLGMKYWKEVQEHDGPCVCYRIDRY